MTPDSIKMFQYMLKNINNVIIDPIVLDDEVSVNK